MTEQNDGTQSPSTSTLAWVGPFAVFALWLAVDKSLPIANPAKEMLRDGVLLASILFFSRHILPRSAPHWMASIALGLAVCAMWIAPDALFPGWRSHFLFQNSIVGQLKTSIPPSELTPLMLVLRTARAALLVPGARRVVLARLASAVASGHELQQDPARAVHPVRVLEHRGALRAGARLVLGGRTAVRNHLQLVDEAHAVTG
jgi:hypothetical protein